MSESSIKIDLPGSKLYPEDCYSSTFTFSDAKSLEIISKTSDTQQLYKLIGNRISLDVNQLTLQDFYYLLHWQRINSYPNFPIKIPWDCPFCEHSNLDAVEGNKLIITELDEIYEHGLEVPFPNAGNIKMRLQLIKDESTAINYLKKSGIEKNKEALKLVLAACLLEPNGGTLDERVKLVRSLSAEDNFCFESFEKEFDYGVKDFVEFDCESCKEVSKVKFNFSLTRFFSNIHDRTSIRDRILSSKKSLSANRESSRDGFVQDDFHNKSTCKSNGEIKKGIRSAEEVSKEIQEKMKALSQESDEQLIDFNDFGDNK